jgi:hypothetical protein
MVILQTTNLKVNKKVKYREFCLQEENLPIFSTDWWLDAVCGENNWNVAIVTRNNNILASLPYYYQKRFANYIIKMPPLTQTMGPYIKYPEGQNYERKLAFEKRIMNELIQQLPHFDLFIQHFHYSITNWQPFYWNNFKQSTRYTYVIENLSDLASVFANISPVKKRNIKKAEKIVNVKFDLSAKEFYNKHKLYLEKQNGKILYDFKIFERIYSACYNHNAGKTIYAIDNDGNIYSAVFVIWNKNSAYNLISTIDPDQRNSGATSLLMREIIRYISTKTSKFDFEGSMVENIERFYRQFGGKQFPYFLIYKDNRNIIQKGLTYITNRLNKKT